MAADDRLLIFHDISFGVRRLLGAPRDLPDAIRWLEPGPVLGSATLEHQQLFEDYVRRLDWAVGLAVPWWNSLVRNRMAHGDTEREAIRASYEMRPAGPASRPEVVWVVRSFWLACEDVNKQLERSRRVPSEVFLLEWLRTSERELPVSVLSAMPYWPIGLDEAGNFV